jgi:hypothetical protein
MTLKEHTMKHIQDTEASQLAEALGKTTSLMLGQPFDTARALYAVAARVGLVENSLLGSARFGQYIHSLEKLALGPWARQM